MIRNLLNKYVNWIDSTGWKTFFKIYGLAVLYFFVICLIRSDGFGACAVAFPFDPFLSFIAPLMRILELLGLGSFTVGDYFFPSISLLLFLAFLINLYHFGKKESLFRQRALILSQTIKIGLITYFMIVISFYVYLWVSGQHCSFRSCGFLKGYY